MATGCLNRCLLGRHKNRPHACAHIFQFFSYNVGKYREQMGRIDLQQDIYREVADCIIKHSDNIIHGNYDEAGQIFEYANPEVYPPKVAELAEGFGMMAVKLEAREIHLQQLVEELQESNASLNQEIKNRSDFSYMFIVLVTFMCIYIFSINYLQSASIGISSTMEPIISRVMEISVLLLSIWLVKRSRLPLSAFGLTLKGWKNSLGESLIITLPLMALLLVVKIYLYGQGETIYGDSIITFQFVDWSYYTYILAAPLEELICRGIFQGTVQRVMVGRHDWLWAIILTGLIFGVCHIFISTAMGIVALVSSLLWGVMYARHKTLVGVSVSHFLLGNWVGLLGMWQVMAGGV
jgi:membrane protease YdiL (CAAX protease family)